MTHFLLSAATLLECNALVVGISFIFQTLIMKIVAAFSVFECYNLIVDDLQMKLLSPWMNHEQERKCLDFELVNCLGYRCK